MTLDKALRNTLRNTVTRCRRLLEEAVGDVLEGRLGIGRDGQVEDAGRMGHLSEAETEHREEVISHLHHIEAGGFKPTDAVAQLIREAAYTHLNRLCAYKMLERRKLIREAVGRGLDSNGFKFYLVDHPEDERLWSSGLQDLAYRHFLGWLGGTLSEEIGVLFSPNDPANRLFPPQRTLDAVLDLVNSDELSEVWDEEETIGWVYQYYTPKELRDQVRKESQTPRNSYELSFRNQFYTPRYVVQFLVDNTLGRTWYEMRQGNTRLTEQCEYLVRRPDEVFLDEATVPEVSRAQSWLQGLSPAEPDFVSLGHTVNGYNRVPGFGEGGNEWVEERLLSLSDGEAGRFETQELLDLLFLLCRKDRFVEGTLDELVDEVRTLTDVVRERVDKGKRDELPQEERLRAPVFVPHRAQKDPRELRILDPACGSGHFLLYCFDLLETIYDEAYDDEYIGEDLREEYPERTEFRRAVPALILRHNLHGIDIDVRATQIAALALWLRAQRAYGQQGLEGSERPKITRSNIVCAEPMPGEREMLEEFAASLEPAVLGQLVEVVFDKMKLAGEAGSLLKIEEEIKGAIEQARAQWQREFERAKDRRGNELLLTHLEMDRLSSRVNTHMGLFDVSQITNEEFWVQAEGRVIEALRSYSAEATNGQGYQRTLFAEDAAQGFAFVDTCRQRFDVVLMNPPYGEGTASVDKLLQAQFPNSKNDLYAAFVEHGLHRLQDRGLLGALTGRNGFVHAALSDWRASLLSQHSFVCTADLGAGVLDAAWVDTASYIIERTASVRRDILFVDLRDTDSKSDHLLASINGLQAAHNDPRVFERRASFFTELPKAPLIYRATNRIRALFTDGPRFEEIIGQARLGLRTLDDFRYVRTSWEAPLQEVGWNRRWVLLNKGGSFSRFYFDFHLLLDWGDNGRALKAAAAKHGSVTRIIQAQGFYGLPGLTYPRRSIKGFSVRALPESGIFTDKGTSIFLRNEADPLLWLGILNSSLMAACVEMQSGSAAYEVGYVQRLPALQVQPSAAEEITKGIRGALAAKRELASMDVTSRYFVAPWNDALPESLQALNRNTTSLLQRAASLEAKMLQRTDELLNAALGFDKEDERALFEILAQREGSLSLRSSGLKDELEEDANVSTGSEAAHGLTEYCVGLLFGRWDIRIAHNASLAPTLPDPFAPLPNCPPGMLVGPDGLPASRDEIASEEWIRARPSAITAPPEGSVRSAAIPDTEYPLAVDWDGILVDDADHPDDVVRRVREVLELLWEKRADMMEAETCQILGVKDLRTFFRNPRQFFDHHIKRYSKSRRKAPIYWLLQSPKRSYGLWLYYHRLDPDSLFKALHKYVEPKIRLEESRLEEHEARRRSAGTGGREAKQAGKAMEKQEELLADLREFRDRLERATKLHLSPDLNDGVVLNIAPLHELVPWKEAKSKWNELLAGKYEWSSIGRQLRGKGLV